MGKCKYCGASVRADGSCPKSPFGRHVLGGVNIGNYFIQ